MSRRTLALIALAALPLSAADWSDTFLGYRTGNQFREPGIYDPVAKNIVTLSHASGWAYGSNFFNVDMLMSDKGDPTASGRSGANEVYVVYRGSLSLGKVTGKDLGFGPVRDVSLTAGFDFNAKDNAFASKKRFLVAGPTLHLKTAKGFWDLSLLACHEQNYNGIVGRSVDFKTTYLLHTAWAAPFSLGSAAFVFKGFAQLEGAKGKDGFGADTKPETLSDMALLWDAGAAFGAKGKVLAGLGFEYWNNKFGGANSDAPAPATNKRVTAPMAQLEIHF